MSYDRSVGVYGSSHDNGLYPSWYPCTCLCGQLCTGAELPHLSVLRVPHWSPSTLTIVCVHNESTYLDTLERMYGEFNYLIFKIANGIEYS